ncbi:Glycine rich protein [Dillenia turbinata]|uniref:Glycine rich protein n=1 Tax=Dillenia turbinata TaxID=194707 RepID=A0AAN8YZE3_9MAGN
MGSKDFIFLGLVVTFALLNSSQVRARELAEMLKNKEAAPYPQVVTGDRYRGGYNNGGIGGYSGGGGNYGGYDPGYGDYGGYPGYGGNYGGRGGGGYNGWRGREGGRGQGYCRYGCCGDSDYDDQYCDRKV